jgi:hypothetical protein
MAKLAVNGGVLTCPAEGQLQRLDPSAHVNIAVIQRRFSAHLDSVDPSADDCRGKPNGASSTSTRPSIAGVIVTFTKPLDLRHFPVWVAANGKCRIQGSSLGCHDPRLPHDVVTLIVERELGIRDGFFDTVASGGTFRSMVKRRHNFGRSVISQNRAALQRSEHLVHRTLGEWQNGIPNAAAEALDAAEAAWAAVAPGATLALEWNTHRRPFGPSTTRQHAEQRRRARR